MKKKSCFVVVGKNFIAPLYPGLQISGMTNGAECDFPAPRHPVRACPARSECGIWYGIWARQGGFTLIELLVVVLIIGILAAVAVPQYQKAVEKARMTEAIMLVRTIANAHQVFYMANGYYAKYNEIDLLDVEIPGASSTSTANWFQGRIKTKFFLYSPNGDTLNKLAVAHRLPTDKNIYSISISQAAPGRVHCTLASPFNGTAVQHELCQQLETKGTL